MAALLAVGVVGLTPDGSGLLQPVDDAARAAISQAGWSGGRWPIWVASVVVPAVMVSLLACAGQLHRRRRWWGQLAGATTIAVAAAWLVGTALHRPAPSDSLNIDHAYADHSFPSIVGAAAAAAVLVALRAERTPARRTGVLAVASVVVLAAARVATDTAWLSDEIAGLALGVAAAGAVVWQHRAVRHRRHRMRLAVAAGAVATAAVAIPLGVTYSHYLTAPGNAAVSDRTVEYLRDHRLGELVDRAESWWLWIHPPATHGRLARLPPAPIMVAGPRPQGPASPPAADGQPPSTTTTRPATTIPDTASSTAPPATAPEPTSSAPPETPPSTAHLPAPITGPLSPPLATEGQWSVAAQSAAGEVEIATTSLRADPDHPTVVAAVAWINQTATLLEMFRGQREPSRGAGPAGAQIPADRRDRVLAAFNSGYRMKDTPGGAMIEGRLAPPIAPDVATAAIDAAGHVNVGTWGSDLDPNADYVAIRQNLHLIVADGAMVPGVPTNEGRQWGTVRNQLPTWRSGIGITAAGDLVYVAGDQLTLPALADTLARAGAIRAMELDIHRDMVSFNLFTHDGGAIAGHKLLPAMSSPGDRYLSPDWRDFFVVMPVG